MDLKQIVGRMVNCDLNDVTNINNNYCRERGSLPKISHNLFMIDLYREPSLCNIHVIDVPPSFRRLINDRHLVKDERPSLDAQDCNYEGNMSDGEPLSLPRAGRV